MDLQSNLIESSKHRHGGRFKYSAASLGVHGLIVAFIVFMTASATHRVAAEDRPIRVFMSNAAAPPPPPPPPPPPAASSAPHATPQIVKPVVVPQTSFVQPREIPKELPKVDVPATTVDTTPSQPSEPAGEPGGVPGGVAGGVVGGVQGGVVGGVMGGQVGGTLGGQVGGTGTEPAAPPPPPEPKPEGPMRVGGEVKAPVVTRRVEPQYTETARKARVQGVVIVEAIIDKSGNVDHVKVLRGLPMGLSEQAVAAVKEWKFRPGTLNGDSVDVIFDLVVNFTLDASGPKMKVETTSTE